MGQNSPGTAKRLRQVEAVHDEPGNHGDSPAAGEKILGSGLSRRYCRCLSGKPEDG